MDNCLECPLKDKCKEWKDNQVEKAKTNKIKADLKEMLKNYCPIKDWAFARAIRGGK